MYQTNLDPWAAAALAWPGIDLPRAAFMDWLAARPAAAPIHVADHFLACACLEGIAPARDAFARSYLQKVERYLRSLARSPDHVDEVRQRVAIRVLVGEDERGPRLADYTGQGSLEGWVRVVATRVALQLTRAERPSQPLDDVNACYVDAQADSELAYLRQRYRGPFRDALARALARLDPTHRMMLRLHFVEGMTTTAMATLYQVSRATLVRRISDAKMAVRDGVASELTRVLNLSAADSAELLISMRSVLDVSIARLLTEP